MQKSPIYKSNKQMGSLYPEVAVSMAVTE